MQPQDWAKLSRVLLGRPDGRAEEIIGRVEALLRMNETTPDPPESRCPCGLGLLYETHHATICLRCANSPGSLSSGIEDHAASTTGTLACEVAA